MRKTLKRNISAKSFDVLVSFGTSYPTTRLIRPIVDNTLLRAHGVHHFFCRAFCEGATWYEFLCLQYYNCKNNKLTEMGNEGCKRGYEVKGYHTKFQDQSFLTSITKNTDDVISKSPARSPNVKASV